MVAAITFRSNSAKAYAEARRRATNIDFQVSAPDMYLLLLAP